MLNFWATYACTSYWIESKIWDGTILIAGDRQLIQRASEASRDQPARP